MDTDFAKSFIFSLHIINTKRRGGNPVFGEGVFEWLRCRMFVWLKKQFDAAWRNKSLGENR